MDADDAVTSWFPAGGALEISKHRPPGSRRTPPCSPALEDLQGLVPTRAAAFWASGAPPHPPELLLVLPPTKHVIFGFSDFFLMTGVLRFPVMSWGC